MPVFMPCLSLIEWCWKRIPPDWRSRCRRTHFLQLLASLQCGRFWLCLIHGPRRVWGSIANRWKAEHRGGDASKGRRNPNVSYYPFSVPTDIRIKRCSRCHLARLMQTTLFCVSLHARRPITSYGSIAVWAAQKAITSSRISSVNRRWQTHLRARPHALKHTKRDEYTWKGHTLSLSPLLPLLHTHCTLYLPEGESALFLWISVPARDPSHAFALMNISQ